MSVLDDISALYTAITGDEPNEQLADAVGEICYLAGSADFPSYLRQAAVDLANHRTREPTEVAKTERKYGWLLHYLAEATPGSEFDSDGNNYSFFAPSIGLAIVINGVADPETFAVVPWPSPAPAGPIILNTFGPSEAEIRQWAYDENLHFSTQDEELAIEHRTLIPLLLELADDPACPRRRLLQRITARMVLAVSYDGLDHLLIASAGDFARRARTPELRSWGADLAELERFIAARPQRVTHDKAERLAKIILCGVQRSALSPSENPDGPPWSFKATHEAIGRLVSELHVDPETGTLEYTELPDLVRVKL